MAGDQSANTGRCNRDDNGAGSFNSVAWPRWLRVSSVPAFAEPCRPDWLLGTGGLQKRLDSRLLADESLFYYAGLLAQSPHSAVALEQILSDYFQVPVAIDQFAGRWYRLDKT